MAPAIKARPSRSSPMQGTDFGNSLRSTARPQPTFYDSVANPVAQHDNDHAHFRDIEILPTTDEILAVGRPIFMPKKDDGSPNPISPGPERFLDLQFRHLRFESTESIKDICYSAAQSAFLNPNRIANDHYADTHAQNSLISAPQQPCNPHVMIRKDTPSGNPYFLYQNTRVEELEAHERHGVLVRLSYDCPTFMRGRIFADTGRLEQGMLLSLLCHDRTKNELSTHFLSIHMAQSTMSMEPRSGKGRRAAVQAAFLPGATKEDAIEFARLAQHLEPDIEMVMVEFPKMLPTGFCSPLRRLQEMSGFAFDQYLAPKRDLESIKVTRQLKLSGHAVSHLVCQRPEYSSARDFEYDLSSILLNVDNNAKTTFTVDELSYQSTIDNLLTSSTLDEGQIHALTHSLRNEFAFTQGPPGTGKTYLGIQLTRVLLDSRPGKPILVVCLTNHALDSFLAGLRDEGIKNLLRIGNGSKEDWTQAFNLREKTRKARLTPNEQQVKRRLRERRNTLFANIHDWCRSASSQSLTGRAGWYAVDKLLAATEPVLHRQLKLTDNRASQKFLFDHWVEGGDLKALRQLRDRLISSHQGGDHSKSSPGPGPDEVLESVCKAAEVLVPQTGAKSVWQMTPDERRATLDKWHTDIDPEQLAMCLANDFADYQATKAGLEAVRDSLDVRVLSQASVIGITTTGCASRWEILKALGIEVVICEEAGEVMEPHALCALLPSLQHAIFIGDPLQLRPEVSEQRLTLERSHDYRLNESLFERMITPLDPSASGLSFAQLTIQRRMHPAIADIARLIYPSLRDHESTRSREATIGVEPRIFWWDHRVPELSETSNTKSHINEHEVNMVAGLVQYLLKGSGYRPGDIAVLTPYSGQLAEFYKALNKTCKVWLNEEDRKLLLKEEQLDIEPTELRKKDEVKMSDLLRITTVDNFQGEEAAVVILSTVRSGTRPGFLKSENRINVACSRARNGFYIIGNSLTLSSVPMWRGVLDVFGSRRGTSLMTYCNNHPEYRFSVTNPDDFDFRNSCPATCGRVLPCGHVCNQQCHPMGLHDDKTIPCDQQCEKALSCGHRCTRACGVDCGTCLSSVLERRLPCGHTGEILCSGEVPRCNFVLGKVVLDCGHELDQLCGTDPVKEHSCNKPCEKLLGCGHICSKVCSVCRLSGHHSCSAACAKPLSCGHSCLARCGHEDLCPPCIQPVRTICEHGTKTRACYAPLKLCLEPATSTCEHFMDPKTPCCIPQAALPCSELCSKVLACGHPCSSLKCEACIPASQCPICTNTQYRSAVLYVRECNHVVEVKELDNLNLQGVYKVDESGTIAGYGIGPFTNLHEPTCTCGRLCPSVHRYSVIHKLVGIDAVMKRLFETIIGGKVCSFAAQVSRVENDLRKSLEAWKSGVRPEAIASAMNSRKIQERADELLELKGKIAEYNDKFVVPVEKAITQLRYAMPSVFPYLPTAHLRLGVIILRLSSVMVGDNIAMAQYLSTLPDPALMTQRMSEVLLQATVNGAEASRKQCIKLLEDEALKKVPALACELQLRQIQLWLLVDCGLEAMPSETLLAENINAPIDHKLEDIPDMLDILDAVLDSSKRYPQTCSSFSSATTNFKHLLGNIIEGQSVGTVPGIDITSARKVERRFREYVGAKRITVCAENHPYFEDVFGKNGCPDCGKKVELDEEVFRHSGKFLFENDFLAAIETMSLHSAPQTSPMLSEGGNFTSTNVARVAEVHANGTASAPVTSSNAAAALVTEDSADACSDATTEVLDDNQATPAKATVSNGQGKSSKPGGTDEDAFLQAMVGQGWSFKSENDEAGGRSLPRAQKTPEERFLESMKRLMADKENAK